MQALAEAACMMLNSDNEVRSGGCQASPFRGCMNARTMQNRPM